MKFNIKHISLRSAFKVGCLMYVGMFLCLVFGTMVGWVGSMLGLVHNPAFAALTGAGLVTLFPVFIGYALVIGIIPGLFFAFWSFIYNIVAHNFGGIVVTLERQGEVNQSAQIEKPKRTSEIDDLEKQIRVRRAKIAP